MIFEDVNYNISIRSFLKDKLKEDKRYRSGYRIIGKEPASGIHLDLSTALNTEIELGDIVLFENSLGQFRCTAKDYYAGTMKFIPMTAYPILFNNLNLRPKINGQLLARIYGEGSSLK